MTFTDAELRLIKETLNAAFIRHPSHRGGELSALIERIDAEWDLTPSKTSPLDWRKELAEILLSVPTADAIGELSLRQFVAELVDRLRKW